MDAAGALEVVVGALLLEARVPEVPAEVCDMVE
jgi:hypothetical protein